MNDKDLEATQPAGETLDTFSPAVNEEEESPSVWGVLRSLNPDYDDFLLSKALASHEQNSAAPSRAGYLLGRHLECDIRFTNPQISNRHCLIYKENCWNDHLNCMEECVFIEDLSTNGTFINGKHLGRNKQYRLQHGDEIQLAISDPQKTNREPFDDRFYMFQLPRRMRKSHASGDSIHDKYLITKSIGSGNFATVKLAVDRETGEKVAIKVVLKSRIRAKPKFIENLRQEIAILMGLRHPNIVSINGVYDEAQYVYIVLELVQGGELFDAIVEHRKFSESVARKVMFQLFSALKYLHDRGITHRDLKPENILLVSRDLADLRIKISDFGLAKLAGEDSFYGTLCGTPNYVAPEVLAPSTGRAYTKAVDLWSCGVILYICLCGFPPFSEELSPPGMPDQIRQGIYKFQSPWWDRVSPEAIDLIKGLLTVDPEKRLTVDQALDHPWMKKSQASNGSPLSMAPDTVDPIPQFIRGDTLLSPAKKNRKRESTPPLPRTPKKTKMHSNFDDSPATANISPVSTPGAPTHAPAAENSRLNSNADSVMTDVNTEGDRRSSTGSVHYQEDDKGSGKKGRRTSGGRRKRDTTPELTTSPRNVRRSARLQGRKTTQ
ncbi:CAMK protein kinase [Spizellomyces punctatus DAOM BR117]|uniref:CAMK protein kinase n=1 Tax=Spizellomyces punctatus (strain DAOM BR117) TaxID=645134 RepID=A0A0L0HNX7_SPIPD|nr:CAMK protein kinase [Spizellomyces punctatus DAOM BR117]KND02797.1 CAMK protein kinase [Spizellomyces punctatus DAOM BR117]|eukprot:XP_016610836.1 CAMK protein kinase [Spizellomyces punctatus DAOM BR117]